MEPCSDVYFTWNHRVVFSLAPLNVRFPPSNHADHISLKCSVLNVPRQCKIYAAPSDSIRVLSLSLSLSLGSFYFSNYRLAPENVPVKIPRSRQTCLGNNGAMVSLMEEMDWQNRPYLSSKWHRAFVFENTYSIDILYSSSNSSTFLILKM